MNPRPIVGILAQELSYSLMEIFANKTSYIGAAYVKYIEAAGARVVPVLINQVSFLAVSSFILPLFTYLLKFIYSEKATKFCEISTVDLTVTT